MKNLVIVLTVIVVVGLGFWVSQSKKIVAPPAMQPTASEQTSTPTPPTATAPTPTPAPKPAEVMKKEPPAIKIQEVVYQNNSFAPATLKIKVGDKVTFVNNHVANIRIASNPHPVHTSFPEFDSDTLEPSQTFSFTFNSPGTFNYHNHFNPGVTGQVIVE